MNAYTLKDKHLAACPNSHFFDYATLKFFGERMSEMRVMKDTIKIKDSSGKEHECYVLSSRQMKYPGGPRRIQHYFDVYTFEQVLA